MRVLLETCPRYFAPSLKSIFMFHTLHNFFSQMAISFSSVLPSLSYLSSLFSQQTTRRKFRIKTFGSDSNPPALKIKLDESSSTHFHEMSKFVEREKDQDALEIQIEDKSSAQVLASQEEDLDMKNFAQRENLNREENTFTKEKPWWYQLQYVMGIFLSGAENNNAPKGLYSIQRNPNPRNEASISYAVVFEGQDDAKKFCYLLDSFFEGLDDVSADIMPLQTQQIKEAVESNELCLIVVPKGKIELYVGQTLEEVEIAFRSLLDEIQES